jgi:hypothetical protein
MSSNDGSHSVSSRRLWFGFVAGAFSWVALGCLDLLITWRACTFQEGYGIPAARPDIRVTFVGLALLLLFITVAAGVTSYRNWRSISTERRLLETNAVDREEFMALIGVIVSISLGMGIVWLALPPLFLDLCWRAR